jgi:hypothetical protein
MSRTAPSLFILLGLESSGDWSPVSRLERLSHYRHAPLRNVKRTG